MAASHNDRFALWFFRFESWFYGLCTVFEVESPRFGVSYVCRERNRFGSQCLETFVVNGASAVRRVSRLMVLLKSLTHGASPLCELRSRDETFALRFDAYGTQTKRRIAEFGELAFYGSLLRRACSVVCAVEAQRHVRSRFVRHGKCVTIAHFAQREVSGKRASRRRFGERFGKRKVETAMEHRAPTEHRHGGREHAVAFHAVYAETL